MKLLAFDTSTDVMSVAVTDGDRVWQHAGPGGAQASATLIPVIFDVLAQAGLALAGLDALVFGRGPGSFTGLRTACAVAQGLALGAHAGEGIPVLPVDTLLALAEEARFQHQPAGDIQVAALLDARMDEIYLQRWACRAGQWHSLGDCRLVRPEDLRLEPADSLWAGNVFAVYAARLPAAQGQVLQLQSLPTAQAMLRLAPALLAQGQGVAAAAALPVYIRDKVALTTEERALVKAGAAAAGKG